MKQIMFNSKLSLPIVEADKPFRSTVVTSGTGYCCGAKCTKTDFWPLYRQWGSCVSQGFLICTLAMSGCTSKDSDEYLSRQGKQKPQEQGSSTTKPVHKEVGQASWYGTGFQGKETSNGETFDQKDMTAAHPNLPMGTMAQVTNLENGKKVEVRINDRGPFKGDRAIDLSSAAAKKIDMKKGGTTEVKIETKSKSKSKSKSKPTKKKNFAKHAKKTRPGKKAVLWN